MTKSILEKFRNHLKLNCTKPRTIQAYYYCVQKYMDFSNNEISQEKINDYLVKLIDEEKSVNTYNQIVSALTHLIVFSGEEIKLPKAKKQNKKMHSYLTQKEFDDILYNVPDIFEEDAEKVCLVLKMYFYTGLRKQELINLKRENILLNDLEIHLLNTKSSQDAIIPITEELAKEIKEYFNREDEQENAFNISTGYVNYIFSTVKKQLCLKDFRPHLLRHSWAMFCLSKGLDIMDVKRLLRHESLETTAIYTMYDLKTVKEHFYEKMK